MPIDFARFVTIECAKPSFPLLLLWVFLEWLFLGSNYQAAEPSRSVIILFIGLSIVSVIFYARTWLWGFLIVDTTEELSGWARPPTEVLRTSQASCAPRDAVAQYGGDAYKDAAFAALVASGAPRLCKR